MIQQTAWTRDPSFVDRTGLWARGSAQRSRPRCTTGLSAREQSKALNKLRGHLAPSTVLNSLSCSNRAAVCKRTPGNNPCRDYSLYLLNHAWWCLVSVGQRQLQPPNSKNNGGGSSVQESAQHCFISSKISTCGYSNWTHSKTQVLDGHFQKCLQLGCLWKNACLKMS